MLDLHTSLAHFMCIKQLDDGLLQIFRDLVHAAKAVNKQINRAGLTGILGSAHQSNVQGEEQQKLDVFANTCFKQALKQGGRVAAIISEEDEHYTSFDKPNSKYLLAIDPLDGSSNIDVNISIGTIFSIYQRTAPLDGAVHAEELLQAGHTQVAAGYFLYGPSTMLVYTTGDGVNGFTYAPDLGDFFLSHAALHMPKKGNIYAINEGLHHLFSPAVRRYVDDCKRAQLTARYVGSLVADFHRNVIKGGIYIYPVTKKAPQGKLRLLYECNALAFLAEQAGGKAINEAGVRILDILPTHIHARTSFFVGAQQMVEKVSTFL